MNGPMREKPEMRDGGGKEGPKCAVGVAGNRRSERPAAGCGAEGPKCVAALARKARNERRWRG